MYKKGFTLAEILITLGVIGVVSAITIPNVVNNYKIKQHEISFKKADSMIKEALKRSINELGYTNVNDLTYEREANEDAPEERSALKQVVLKLNEIWIDNFKTIGELPNCYRLCEKDIRQDNILRERMGMCRASCYMRFTYNSEGKPKIYLLSNGMAISEIEYVERSGWGYYWAGFAINFDTNGPYKGPNSLGIDIFTYYPNRNLTDIICNPTVTHSRNYLGCYFFAEANQSPLSSSEPYWNLLYKSRSYWENYNK